MDGLARCARKTGGRRAPALLLAVLMAASLGTSALRPLAAVAEPAPAGSSVRSFFAALHSFLGGATYLRFESKAREDMALAQANLANARDLVSVAEALGTSLSGVSPTLLDTFLAGFGRNDGAAALAGGVEQLRQQFSALMEARAWEMTTLQSGGDPTIVAGPAAPGARLCRIEAGAAGSINAFVKKWSVVAGGFDPDRIPLGLFTFVNCRKGT